MILEIIQTRQAKISEQNVVKRVLPFRSRRSLGPFCFLDHMGPMIIPDDRSGDVLSHPHIGLETVTYLFSGQLYHRDSLGNRQVIKPGDVNWMTAGRGIAHSERNVFEAHDIQLHGLQAWVALPKQQEDCDPAFVHYPSSALPKFKIDQTEVNLVTGEFLGHNSPVKTYFDTLYVSLKINHSSSFSFFNKYEELGFYLVDGSVQIDNEIFEQPTLIVFKPNHEIKITSIRNTIGVLIGGQKLPEPRFMFWNFVSTDKDKIEKAKASWKSGQFAKVIDETDIIPLPEN